jgi:hypothetical protein
VPASSNRLLVKSAEGQIDLAISRGLEPCTFELDGLAQDELTGERIEQPTAACIRFLGNTPTDCSANTIRQFSDVVFKGTEFGILGGNALLDGSGVSVPRPKTRGIPLCAGKRLRSASCHCAQASAAWASSVAVAGL